MPRSKFTSRVPANNSRIVKCQYCGYQFGGRRSNNIGLKIMAVHLEKHHGISPSKSKAGHANVVVKVSEGKHLQHYADAIYTKDERTLSEIKLQNYEPENRRKPNRSPNAGEVGHV